MRKTSKIIFISSIAFIVLAIVVAILKNSTSIYFVDRGHKDLLDVIVILGTPIAVLLTVSGIIKKNDRVGIKILKLAVMLALASMVLACEIWSSLDDICTMTNVGTLYENKQDVSRKIVLKEFGCGAVDSTPFTVAAYESESITPLFVKLTLVDTNKIDRSDWRRVQIKSK